MSETAGWAKNTTVSRLSMGSSEGKFRRDLSGLVGAPGPLLDGFNA